MADPSTPKPPTVVELVWEHDLVFGGSSGDAKLSLDSAGAAGPSPMQALAFGFAGCMAMDVVYILKKGRHDLRGLRLHLTGERAAEPPRRFTAFSLRFEINGDIPQDAVDRAIELSREKYCSVWHTLRQDIPLQVVSTIATPATPAGE
jgi:putative redox protein